MSGSPVPLGRRIRNRAARETARLRFLWFSDAPGHPRLWPRFPGPDQAIVNEKFAFVQIPKTGSSSILHSCAELGLTRYLPGYRHEGLAFLSRFIPAGVPVYACVRNPYDQVLSYFFHQINYGELKVDESDVPAAFGRFCKEQLQNTHLRQADYLKSGNGVFSEQVQLFKFEAGLEAVCETLNRAHSIALRPMRINRNPLAQYQRYRAEPASLWDETSRRLVAAARTEDFAKLGYDPDDYPRF